MDLISFWLVLLTLLLFLGYTFLIRFYHRGWRELKEFETPPDLVHSQKVTIIIPARNEEKNISNCLNSLLEQSYPSELVDILVINDHSTDETERIVAGLDASRIRLINLSEYITADINSYKKKAIAVGLELSTSEWIITTDADCIAPKDWLKSMMAYQEATNAKLIAGPVRLAPANRLIEIFQSLDFMLLQGITGASVSKRFHSMCNGANLGYAREAFLTVGGFDQVETIASGDDMFLMHKIEETFPGKSFYLKSKSAIMNSLPASDWKNFWQQRIRWASKATTYKDKRIFRALLLVYLLNLFLLLLFVAGFWNSDAFLVAFLLLVCKTLIEYPFASELARFFEQKRLLVHFVWMQPLHIVYTVAAGWLGQFKTYEWKGRRVK